MMQTLRIAAVSMNGFLGETESSCPFCARGREPASRLARALGMSGRCRGEAWDARDWSGSESRRQVMRGIRPAVGPDRSQYAILRRAVLQGGIGRTASSTDLLRSVRPCD